MSSSPKGWEERRKKASTSMQKVLLQLLGAPDRTFPEADLPVAEPLRLQRLLLGLADSSRCAGYYNREAWGQATPGLAPGRKNMHSSFKSAFKLLVECVGLRVLDGVMRLTEELHNDDEEDEDEDGEDGGRGGNGRQGQGRRQIEEEDEVHKVAHSNPPLAGSSSMHAALCDDVAEANGAASSSTGSSNASNSKSRGGVPGKGREGGRGYAGRASRRSGFGSGALEKGQEQDQQQAKRAEAMHRQETKAVPQEKNKLAKKEGEKEVEEEQQQQQQQQKEEGGDGEGGGGIEKGAKTSSCNTILPGRQVSPPLANGSSAPSTYVPAKHNRFCPSITHKLYLNGALLEFATWLGDMGRAES
eukprot:evm.model.NODE_32843_length_3634_cov_31.132360.2